MKLRWLALALLTGLAVPFIVPALAADQTVVAGGVSNTFTQATVTIDVGDTVTWTNAGGSHNVKFDNGSFEDPPTAVLPTDGEWQNGVSRTFDTDATLRYHCELHGGPNGFGMSGTVVVGNGGPTNTTPTNTTPTNTTPTNTTPTNTGPTNTTGTNTTGGGTSDTSEPTIGSLDPAASRFCARRSRTCRRPGLRFRLELSEAATLEGVVTRTRRLRGSATRRSFTRAGREGVNNIKVSARGLAKGRYRLRLTARDAAGNRSSPVTTRFTVSPSG